MSSNDVRFKVGDRMYEGLILREFDGTPTMGLAVLKRCKELWANAGREDYEFILSNQAEIPVEFQDLIMVFPKYQCGGVIITSKEDTEEINVILEENIHNDCLGVVCLWWDGEKWDIHAFIVSPESGLYNSVWYEHCRFMRRLP